MLSSKNRHRLFRAKKTPNIMTNLKQYFGANVPLNTSCHHDDHEAMECNLDERIDGLLDFLDINSTDPLTGQPCNPNALLRRSKPATIVQESVNRSILGMFAKNKKLLSQKQGDA